MTGMMNEREGGAPAAGAGEGSAGRRARSSLLAAALALGSVGGGAGIVHAQTDYYNTDAGRPVRIEDAHPVERYAFEGQVAPLRLTRSDEGIYEWEIEPELAYGLLPRTHVEVGLPLIVREGFEGGRDIGVGGVDVSVFHNLNVETRTLPALAVAGEVLIPAGGMAPEGVFPAVKAIATRTFRIARLHINGRYAFGAEPEALDDVGHQSRWMAGLAVDRTFPLRAALLIADVFVEEPLHAAEPLRWTAEAGARYQLDPYFALDVGVGRTMTGDDQGWFMTVGAARVFAIRSLMPVSTR